MWVGRFGPQKPNWAHNRQRQLPENSYNYPPALVVEFAVQISSWTPPPQRGFVAGNYRLQNSRAMLTGINAISGDPARFGFMLITCLLLISKRA
jgi:hypothetical protein